MDGRTDGGAVLINRRPPACLRYGRPSRLIFRGGFLMGGSFALYFNGNAVYTTSGGKRQRCFCFGETATQEKGRKGAGKGQETATQFFTTSLGRKRKRPRCFPTLHRCPQFPAYTPIYYTPMNKLLNGAIPDTSDRSCSRWICTTDCMTDFIVRP